jgi:hypothetical protein
MPSDSNRPYISVVVAARNDNHGGDMVGRMQAFLDSWMLQAERYGLESEMVVVEWNPPANRGKLQDEFRWAGKNGLCPARFIEVSREIHASLLNASSIPLHQMIAKNVGVRRARGEFVLCTNLDIIFSAELMQFLARRDLDARAMYRMDRYDIAKDIPAQAGVEELLGFCRTHILRVCAREGVFDTNGDNIRPVEQEDILPQNSGLQLGRGWYGLERYADTPIMRYVEEYAEVVFDRARGRGRHILFDLEIGPSARNGRIDLDLLDAGGERVGSAVIDGHCKMRVTPPAQMQAGKFELRVRNGGLAMVQEIRMLDLRVFTLGWEKDGAPARNGWTVEVIERKPGVDRTYTNPAKSPYTAQMRNPQFLHCNACGDFTMLSREAWFDLRGYPEFPFWPTHLDSLFCYAAYHGGVPEVILKDPLRVFHIDHQAIWTPETEAERAERAAKRGVDLVGYLKSLEYFHLMRRFNAPMIFNGANWGLGGMNLPESAP